MSYGKRQATSPRENMAKNTKADYEVDTETLVKIELETLNGKPYLGQISDDELIYIWVKVFNQSHDNLFGVTSTKTLTRNVRATFKSNSPVKLTDLSKTAEFVYEKFPDDGQSEVISGKILGFGALKPAQLGELVKVTVKTNFGVAAPGVLDWLKNYGTLSASHQFVVNPSTGKHTDVLQTEIVLRRHIEEYLPMYGQKVQVYYPGMPRMCNRCYTVGHLRRECNNKKREWIEYVISLLQDGRFSEEMVGTWRNAVARWKNANASASAK
jgi:hypothetical protein